MMEVKCPMMDVMLTVRLRLMPVQLMSLKIPRLNVRNVQIMILIVRLVMIRTA